MSGGDQVTTGVMWFCQTASIKLPRVADAAMLGSRSACEKRAVEVIAHGVPGGLVGAAQSRPMRMAGLDAFHGWLTAGLGLEASAMPDVPA